MPLTFLVPPIPTSSCQRSLWVTLFWMRCTAVWRRKAPELTIENFKSIQNWPWERLLKNFKNRITNRKLCMITYYVHGWSFRGYLVLTLLIAYHGTYPNAGAVAWFSCGVAGAKNLAMRKKCLIWFTWKHKKINIRLGNFRN